MSDRLDQRAIDLYANPEGGSAEIDGVWVIVSGDNTALLKAAQEVQASRKLIADLRTLKPKGNPGSLHYGGSNQALQAVRRLIDEAGL